MKAVAQRGGLDHPLVWVGVVAATLLSLYVLNLVWWLSVPLVLAVIFQQITSPFVDYLKVRGISNNQALAVFLFAVSVMTLGVLLVLVPYLTSVGLEWQEQLPEFAAELQILLVVAARDLEQVLPWLRNMEFAELVEAKTAVFWEQTGLGLLQPLLVRVIYWIPSLLLVPYLAFFMIKDAARFKKLLMRGVPNAFFEKVLMLISRMDRQLKAYFRGLMAMTFLDTVTLAAGLWLIGLPYGIFGPWQALCLGLMAAVLAWVPYVGSVLGCLIIVMVCLLSVPGAWFLVIAAVLLFVLVRLIDDFFYTPLTIGRSLSVHPLLTVMVIFCGGMLGGATGLLLAMPVLGLAMVLGDVFGQVWFDDRLRARHEMARTLRRNYARKGLDAVSGQ